MPDSQEPTKAEPTKTEPTKTEPTKTEPTKTEPTKAEPTKTEPTKTEPKPETSGIPFGGVETRAHIVELVRDSGVVLAGAAALLYVASHVYGMQYLGVYGIGDGLHGFGLAHLAMIPLFTYLSLGCFGWAVYKTLSSESKFWLVVGNLLILVVTLTRLLYALAYGAGAESVDVFGLLLGACSLFVSLILHWGVTPKIKRLAEASARALEANGNSEQLTVRMAELAAKLQRLDELTAARAHLSDEPVVAEWLDGARQLQAEGASALDKITNETTNAVATRTEFAARINRVARRYRLELGLVAGLMTLAAALPALATIEAISAAEQEHYVAITPNTPPRRPVYWVGDRVVYLTTEGTKCYVHVQIANVEQSKRECPRLIATVTQE